MRREKNSDMTALVLSTLSPREQEIIRLRFGIGVRIHSREEAARPFGMSAEELRYAEVQAIRKLKRPGLRWLWQLTPGVCEHERGPIRVHELDAFDRGTKKAPRAHARGSKS